VQKQQARIGAGGILLPFFIHSSVFLSRFGTT